MEVTLSRKFKKDLKKLRRSGTFNIELLDNVINLFIADSVLPDSYKDHQLKGPMAHFRECHIKPDVLLIYEVEDKKITLTRIGSHSQLFE